MFDLNNYDSFALYFTTQLYFQSKVKLKISYHSVKLKFQEDLAYSFCNFGRLIDLEYGIFTALEKRVSLGSAECKARQIRNKPAAPVKWGSNFAPAPDGNYRPGQESLGWECRRKYSFLFTVTSKIFSTFKFLNLKIYMQKYELEGR